MIRSAAEVVAAPEPGADAAAAAPQQPAVAAPFAAAPAGGATGHAGLDDLFVAPEAHEYAKDEKKRAARRRGGCLVTLLILLAIAGGLTAAGFWVWDQYGERISEQFGWGEPKDFEPGQNGDPVLVTVASGDTWREISSTLFSAGVTKTDEALYDYMIEEAIAATAYPGVYELREQMAASEALAALRDPANRRENTVLLREGLTVEQSISRIAEALGLPLEDVTAAVADPAAYGVTADSLEGWLFPATYTFDGGVTASDVIARMVERTRQSLAQAGVPAEREQEILTIASIIEREARFQDDFYKVSRVIQNRLDGSNQETFGLLQMDSTAQYGYNELHDGQVSSTAEALEDDNPWNTYVHPGLPVGPIANPGDLAIDAAMHPADGPWLYFVTVNLDTGETLFSTTLAEHNRGVAQWAEWCEANPDSGC